MPSSTSLFTTVSITPVNSISYFHSSFESFAMSFISSVMFLPTSDPYIFFCIPISITEVVTAILKGAYIFPKKEA